MKRKLSVILNLTILSVLSGLMVIGCSNTSEGNSSDNSIASEDAGAVDRAGDTGSQEASELVVRFGDEGEPFILHLNESATAAAIAKHVGTSDWNLPIYHFDDFENWQVMQYYDVPSGYMIPSDPEEVTEEKAGEVYYSEPNRIILFYQDAEVSAEYTPVGYFDHTEELAKAVENNPVVEGWSNKIIHIKAGE